MTEKLQYAKRHQDRLKPIPVTPRDRQYGFSEPSSCLYVIEADGGPPIKIGISVNPRARADTIQSGQSRKITIYRTYRLKRVDAVALERHLHRELQKTISHARGEWYDIDSETAASVIEREIRRFGLYCVNGA